MRYIAGAAMDSGRGRGYMCTPDDHRCA